MNRPVVLAEWKRALECHAAKAALHVQGIDADSHAAVKRLFGLHLVQPGRIEPKWGTYLGESSEARLMAEYDVQAP
jgi:uncharacterized protein (UPF0332 family)